MAIEANMRKSLLPLRFLRRFSALLSALLLALLLIGVRPVAAQTPPTDPGAYERIVKDAARRAGLFTVYSRKDKWYLEIPKAMHDRDMLWHVEAARVPADFPEGVGEELSVSLVRWSRRGDRIVVAGYDTAARKRSDDGLPQRNDPAEGSKRDPLRLSLEQSGEPVTILAFPIVAESPTGDAVIEIGDVLLTDIPDFKIGNILRIGGLNGGIIDPRRSDIGYVRAFPRNLEASVRLTYALPGTGSASFIVRHSLTLLPDTPMKPRLFDERLGYFKVDFEDYSGEKTFGVEKKAYITRYRLEKKDPGAALSEPVQPITYYISPEVPEKWRPYFKQGVEDWQVAFEAAGFKNAIVARDPPTAAEDPEWTPGDTRYSVIRWVSTPIANAMGPNIHDPRSGEILSAHILIWAQVVSLAQTWYYTMCAATDPRARVLPMPDEVTGRLLRYVIAHEVGHSLGLRHNHRASTAYTVKQLRDKAFTARHGSVASIMAYGRFNYVAQPEDKLPPESLMAQIAPYDKHVIAWGYSPIPNAGTPNEEWPTLDAWAAKAVTNPWLIWTGEDYRDIFDPRVQMQNIGAERLEATRLGLKNLERALSYLPTTAYRKGRSFAYAEKLYGGIMDAWLDLHGSTVKEIAGVQENRTLAGRGAQFQRVGRARQKAALKFLLDNALQRPTAFMPASLYANIQPFALADAVAARQNSLLNSLLSPPLATIMQDAALFNDADRYPYVEYLTDLTNGVFAEIRSGALRIDPLRRSLQRNYLRQLSDNMGEPVKDLSAMRLSLTRAGVPPYLATASNILVSDYRAAGRLVLEELSVRLRKAEATARDRETLAHLRECQVLVRRGLNAGETPVTER
ncbi:MAG: zinc-dependent metalloprotease [Capsulimonadales bacterium]|nr:zinc-dependent metalloprotease [Capsulimonadales bacterium]